jgi:DNA-binding CsgD family transcriptional regulator
VGRGEELEHSRPFGVIADALGCTRTTTDPLRRPLADLLFPADLAPPGAATVSSDPSLQFRAVDACVDLVEQLAVSQPVLLGLDDLQWADPSSLLVLSAIGQRLAYIPLAVVGCFRPAPRLAALEQICAAFRTQGARFISVPALSGSAIAALVADAVAAVPAPDLLDEVASAGGNPLYVTELLTALAQDGTLVTVDGKSDITRRGLPSSLSAAILRRLAFLPESTIRALRVASVLGSSFTLTEMSVVTKQPAMELAIAMEDAIAARVLSDDGSRLRFRHDLIRDAIYAELPGSVRHAMHREIGERLAAAGASARQVAEHMARSAAPGDESAIHWLLTAAREAAGRSSDTAAELLSRAISLLPSDDGRRDQLLAEHATALMQSGRAIEAERAFRELLDRPHDTAVDAASYTLLGQTLLTAGRPAEALVALARAREAPQLDDLQRAAGLGWACISHMWLGQLDEALGVADQAGALAAETGNHVSATISAAMHAVVAQLRGNLVPAVEHIERAIRTADASPGGSAYRYPVHAPHASILVELDRLEEAGAAIDRGIRLTQERGIGWHQPSYSMQRVYERYTAGEWDDALAEAEAGIELAAESGEHFSVIITRSLRSQIYLHRNEIRRAGEEAEAALRQMIDTGAGYRAHWSGLAHALVLEATGDLPAAYARLRASWDACTDLGMCLEYRVFGADLVRLSLLTGHTRTAEAAVAALADLAAGSPVPSLQGMSLRCQGLLADDTELLEASVAAYAESPRVHETAMANEDAGAALIRAGSLERARELLDAAADGYRRLDARRDLARAEALLREAGVRRGSRHTRRRPQHGWAALTPTEQNVARLVAEGLTNPQIGERLYVSRRTVQTHLAHVFAKLGLASRTQLAAEVARHP